VPEGWARRERADGVHFGDKYNAVDVAISRRALAPTEADLRAFEIAALQKSAGAVRIEAVTRLTLPAGAAFVVRYGINSAPNPVTEKAIRLDSERLYFWRGGRLAALTLPGPAGADNAAQWRPMARSFAWTH
jgi:hypothetical protein